MWQLSGVELIARVKAEDEEADIQTESTKPADFEGAQIMDGTPNVLFLVVDSLRYDAVFGEDSPQTPHIDALARESIQFNTCYAQGISTAPSMTSMLTGRYPLDYGGHWYVHDDQPTMAEQFRANGYSTAAIHSNPNVSRFRNFDRGFDTFEENIIPVSGSSLFERVPDRVLKAVNKLARVASKTPYLPADEVNDQILDWIGAQTKPWFLWTHYMDSHGPYLPGAEFSYRNKFRAERLWRKAAVNAPEEVTPQEHAELEANYRKEVEYLDAALGRFFDELDSEGHLEDTIVVLVADHGDEFGEHGYYGHRNLPYEELVHVPLLIRFPEASNVTSGEHIERPVRCLDALPTVLDAVDAELSDKMSRRIEGESLLPLLEGQSPGFDVAITEKERREQETFRFGVRDERWTYFWDGDSGNTFLFDREADPGENTDVIEEFPEVAASFEDVVERRLESIRRTSGDVEDPDLEDGPGIEQRLKALGYR